MKKKFIMGILVTSLVVSSVAFARSKTPVLNRKNITLVVGEKCQLKVKNNKKSIKWSSTKKKVAVVSKKGKVTAKGAGQAKIRAKIGGKTLICKVIVSKSKSTAKPKATPKASASAAPSPGSIATLPVEDPNTRDEGWIPGWY